MKQIKLKWDVLRDGFLIAFAYALLALIIETMPRLSFGSPVWPSAGIALGGLLARGRLCVWGVLLGAAVPGWFIYQLSFWKGMLYACIPTIGSWLSATVLLHFNKTGNFFSSARNVTTFVLASTCTGNLFQALLGAFYFMLDGKISPANYWSDVLNWWVGDMIGVLVFAPLVVTWFAGGQASWRLYIAKWQEIGIVAIVLGVVSYFSFIESQPIEYLVILPLLWSAFHLGSQITTLLVATTGSVASVATLYQRGIFFKITQEFNSVIFLQLFMGVISITTILILVLVAENDRAIQKLDNINQNLEKIIDERTQELTIANQAISELNNKLTAENLRMSSELAVTRKLQQMILPKPRELHAIEALEIAGFMQPADEVGGDYYDVLDEGGKIKVGIGDVTGHGLESGVIMIMVQTAIRALLASGETDLTKLLIAVNRALYKNLQRMNCDKSLTLMLIDYHDHALRITGQHESVIILRQDGKTEIIDTIDLGFPIGLTDEIEGFVFDLSIFLHVGDTVVLYTDGIPEAENAEKELYGIDRMIGVLQKHQDLSVDQMRQAVISDVLSFVGESKLYDDITLVIMRLRDPDNWDNSIPQGERSKLNGQDL
ncbi:MAG: SpoIIE family protein phosphatase [Pseudanabaenaceae cyanobacterium]